LYCVDNFPDVPFFEPADIVYSSNPLHHFIQRGIAVGRRGLARHLPPQHIDLAELRRARHV
jgi:hypothetical protein